MTEPNRRRRSAITDIKLYNDGNFKWAKNTNESRDISLTYEVSGAVHGDRTYTIEISAGGVVSLGPLRVAQPVVAAAQWWAVAYRERDLYDPPVAALAWDQPTTKAAQDAAVQACEQEARRLGLTSRCFYSSYSANDCFVFYKTDYPDHSRFGLDGGFRSKSEGEAKVRAWFARDRKRNPQNRHSIQESRCTGVAKGRP